MAVPNFGYMPSADGKKPAKGVPYLKIFLNLRHHQNNGLAYA
jgi:hypothetical protein